MSGRPATATRPTWGAHRTHLTNACSKVDWSVLTDAQADCLFLSTYHEPKLSERGIGILYGVSGSAVHKHLVAAHRKLEAPARLLVDTPQTTSTRRRPPCLACDTPTMPCTHCIEVLARTAPVYRRTERNGLAAVDYEGWLALCT